MNQILPQHVAIVMDGNGRWAEKRGLLRMEGHRQGVLAAKEIIEACLKKNIPILSLFAFSSENWMRPEIEVNFLMELFKTILQDEVKVLHEHKVCIRFTGAREQLPQVLQVLMQKAEELTALNTNLILNLAINYSGRWDIIQATKCVLKLFMKGDLSLENIENMDELFFGNFLTLQGLPDPDLLIRTSGEQRISNFFLWSIAYTELYFTKIHWPDFSPLEFDKALNDFSVRERRYGRTREQLGRE